MFLKKECLAHAYMSSVVFNKAKHPGQLKAGTSHRRWTYAPPMQNWIAASEEMMRQAGKMAQHGAC